MAPPASLVAGWDAESASLVAGWTRKRRDVATVGFLKPSRLEVAAMTLELMQPDPMWDEDAYEETVDVFEALADDETVTVRVWCRDNCPDCRRELPDFAAALDAAEFPDDRLHQIAVDEFDVSAVGPHKLAALG